LVKLFGQIGPGHLAHLRRITKKSITALPGARARHLGPAQPVAQGIAGALRSLMPAASSDASRPSSVAATAGGRMGDAMGDEMRRRAMYYQPPQGTSLARHESRPFCSGGLRGKHSRVPNGRDH
jgi:hypothetical protein